MESTNELITKKIQHKIRNTLEEMLKKLHISTQARRSEKMSNEDNTKVNEVTQKQQQEEVPTRNQQGMRE